MIMMMMMVVVMMMMMIVMVMMMMMMMIAVAKRLSVDLILIHVDTLGHTPMPSMSVDICHFCFLPAEPIFRRPSLTVVQCHSNKENTTASKLFVGEITQLLTKCVMPAIRSQLTHGASSAALCQ